MRTIVYDGVSENFLTKVLENYKDIGNVGYQTSNCVKKGKYNNVFFKELNFKKIEKLYTGEYITLFNEYYNQIKNLVKTNQILGLLQKDNEIYEFSKLIEDSKFLDNGNKFSWTQIEALFASVLKNINNCIEFNKQAENQIGFETAIWNFTIDGFLFDLDPPKILKTNEDTSFTRKEDINHVKRTIYRSFTEIGMKTNLLVTLILGEKHNSFIIKDKPDNYLFILINRILKSFVNEEEKEKFILSLKNGVNANENFMDHPIEILRREIMNRENNKDKKIIFVAGTSESGKSGGINYLKDNYNEIQHIKIRDVFPKVYADTSSQLSFEEWQDFEENRDLNNFWRLFVNKVYEIADPEKNIIILDTMYGVNGMVELYNILKDNVELLYIDAPFNERVKREYLRLRKDSINGTRKADLSITIDDVIKRTKAKDEKKNKKGANLLPYLSYAETNDSIEIKKDGKKFTYLINNDGTIEDFYKNLDNYINRFIKNRQNFNK